MIRLLAAVLWVPSASPDRHDAVTSIHPPIDTVSLRGLDQPEAAPRRTSGKAWVAFAVYSIVLLVWSTAGAGSTTNIYSALGTLAFIPLNLGGTYWMFRAAANPTHEAGERAGLRLLGVMYVCTAIGNLLWAVDATRQVDPRYSAANLFYISAYVVGIIAMTRFPLAPRGKAELRAFALDVACVAIAVGALVWTFIIAPIDWSSLDRDRLAVDLAYPVSCILLLAMLCRLLMRQASNEQYGDLAIIAGAIFAQCTLDLIVELDYRNTITEVTSWAAAICPSIYIVIVYAAERSAMRTQRGPTQRRDPSLNPTNLLPAIAAMSVYAVLIWAVESDRRDPLGVLLTAALLLNVLFIAKQTISARENAALVRQRADAESRARYEEMAREGQKLEAVGRLAGGIAHDFNNLLTTVLANSEFALVRLKPGSVGHEEVRDIHDAALRAAELVRQLLAFSRKSVVAPVRLRPDVVLRDMERLLQRLAGDQCQLMLTMPPDLGTVLVDRGQLEQAVANLVTNARDAMPTGGIIVISGRNTTLDAARAATLDLPAGEYVAIAVQDSGTGITPDVRAQIFEPFFSTKPRGKGTGLGLASTYGIMRQSSGAIEVETALGSGSRFTLYLPRQAVAVEVPAARQVMPESPQVTPAPRGETILLVEDEAAVRQVTRRMLEIEGYTVLTAANAQAARTVLETHGHCVSLLITDVIMPGETGVELAATLRERWPHISTLFISGYSDADLPLHDAPSADDLLQKPFTGAQLLARVESRIRSPRPAPTVAHSR